MMKKLVKGWCLLAAAGLLAFSSFPVHAAPDPYEYRVRIHAGVQGTFADGSSVKEYEGENGEVTVNFDWEEEVVLPEGSRYYVKGIRESGSEKMENSSFTAKQDKDYVVVYGIRGNNMVKYAIHYVDEAGNTLAKSRYGEGTVGDTPIVGHLPVEGYVPQAYNLTRTLQKEEENNVFIFVYRRVQTASEETGAGTIVTTEEVETTASTETVVVPGEGTGDGGAAVLDGGVTVLEGGGGEEAAGAGAGGAAAGGNAAGAGEGAGAGGAGAGAEEGPAELINLDDGEVPLANPDVRDDVPEGALGAAALFRMPPAVLAGLVSAVVLFAAAFYFLISRRKKKKADEGTDEDE